MHLITNIRDILLTYRDLSYMLANNMLASSPADDRKHGTVSTFFNSLEERPLG